MTTNEKLSQVIKSQDMQTLTAMLNDGVQLNEVELIYVLIDLVNNKDEAKADARFIKMLIDNGVQIDTTTKRTKVTTLMCLSYLGLDEIIEDFISKGFDINAKNIYGMNAFHWAVAKGEYSTAKLLMENGADIFAKAEFEVSYSNWDDITDGNGVKLEEGTKKIQASSFAFAFNKYNPKIIKLLLEKGFDPNEDVMKENILFKFFQDKPTSSYYINNNPISIICKKNDTELLKLMIEKGATRFDISDLAVACKNLNFEMIKLLVENGVEINYTYEGMGLDWENPLGNPLSIVCSNSTIVESIGGKCGSNTKFYSKDIFEIIKYLIEKGADVNVNSPLMASVSLKAGCHKRVSSDNIFYGVDVNIEIIQFLIEKGADVNYRCDNGTSILMEAMKKMNGFELAKILVSNGADVNHKDKKQNSCIFHLDAEYQEPYYQLDDILRLLIDNGADINTKNNMGMTPLMHYALKGEDKLVKILLENGADINAKSEMTAFDLAGSDEIKTLIKDTKNNNPQKLVKILSNFTIDKPIKYTTHNEFHQFYPLMKKEYGNFDGYMSAVKKQFESMKSELKELSQNLYEKIDTFLIEENPDEKYTWCSKTHINIGWSSVKGKKIKSLKEWCDSGNNPFDFELEKSITYKNGIKTITITTFEGIINLFKQEIEIRENFKNLSNLFISKQKKLEKMFVLDLANAKLSRQFYTDVEKFSNALDKIFSDINIRTEYQNVEVTTTELEDRSIEIKITQINSTSSRSAEELLERANIAGDISEIKKSLNNLCDWSIESSFEDEHFRVNFLHSNNVKDIEILESKPKGFTHILRFYK